MRIGIIGGGQLGRMLTQSAKPLGFDVRVLDPQPDCPAAQVGATQVVGALSDPDGLRRLAGDVDVLTWEIEHFSIAALEQAPHAVELCGESLDSLRLVQDKLVQKRTLRDAGIPVGPFYDAVEASSLPESTRVIRKDRLGGFDGRGNSTPAAVADLATGPDDTTYVEELLDFRHELAVIVARGRSGDTAVYPVVETFQENSICVAVESPALIDPPLVEAARDVANEVLGVLRGPGVFAIELFVVDDEVLVNEIAPRVHNSGHFSIEGAVTSQFEQHIRAVAGLPLGSTELRGPAVMRNLLGPPHGPLDLGQMGAALAEPDTHVHLYGKEHRAGRKLGHITALGPDMPTARERSARAHKHLVGG